MKAAAYHTASDGTKIWYGHSGSGPAMVLCDGIACDGFIWPYMIDHFLETHTIIRWHYRGHGQSDDPHDPERVSVEDLCDDLNGILGELGVEEAVFVGHSMGVQVILQYFGLYPEQVQALVPICGTYKRPLDTFHNHDRLAFILPYLDRIVDMAPDSVQGVWETLTTPSKLSYFLAAGSKDINAKRIRLVDFLPYLEHVAQMNVRVFVRMLRHLSEHTTEEILPQINVPTFIIAAEHDSFTPMYRSRQMHELIPNSEWLVLPEATHVGPLEQPELMNQAIEEFLQRHDLTPYRSNALAGS